MSELGLKVWRTKRSEPVSVALNRQIVGYNIYILYFLSSINISSLLVIV